MKNLMLVLAVMGMLLSSAAYALDVEDYLHVDYSVIGPGAEGEVVGSYGITPAIDMKEDSMAIDNEGNIFAVETWTSSTGDPVDVIMIYDSDFNYYLGTLASTLNTYRIEGISFDGVGNMFCILTNTTQQTAPPYGYTTERVLIKLSGFAPYDEQYEELQYQIDTLSARIDEIELIPGPPGPPGPQGDPGITPEEITVIKNHILSLQNQVRRILDWIINTHGCHGH